MSKARYIMIGGFLGAGKSTSVGKLAQHLTDQGRKVGLIVNDQGSELVDTANLRSQGFRVEEITGGCFCCRFNSLVEAADHLTAEGRPDVFIAEPVGSCTDLVATVSYPLRRIYGENFTISPLSVLVDPIRAMRILGLVEGKNFSPKVNYIYRKQLEEADLIVVNKIDLLDAKQRIALMTALAREFPETEIIEICARSGDGLDMWFERIVGEELPAGEAMQVDYEIYAEGEALLGWLNCTLRVESDPATDGNALLKDLAGRLQARLAAAGAEIAHLKMTLSPLEGAAAKIGETGVLSLVRNDYVPELGQSLNDPLGVGHLILNLRAEGEPEVLEKAVKEAASESANSLGVKLTIEHMERFKPGKPQPTHRMEAMTS